MTVVPGAEPGNWMAGSPDEQSIHTIDLMLHLVGPAKVYRHPAD